MSPTLTPLDRAEYRDIVRRALAEDIGRGDVTTEATVPADARARGVFLAKSRCVVAGIDVAIEAFHQLDPSAVVNVHRHDGDLCDPGVEIADVRGLARALLMAERTALNLMQRMSGTATLARRFVEAASGRIVILDTRKTTPLMRTLEKYAVRAGGAENHRIRLDAGVLIKENHIRLAGGVGRAVDLVRRSGTALPVEIEAETLEQVDQALDAGADRILLDNMTVEQIREAVRRARGRAHVEISGGVTLDRVAELATTGADFVSVGALTHSAPAADISFELEPE